MKFYECSHYLFFFFLSFAKILVDQVVMANYNPDEPGERGYWYDVKITKKVKNLTKAKAFKGWFSPITVAATIIEK